MKYFSIDIETTGLDPEKDQVLQIGIVYENTETLLDIEDLRSVETVIDHKRITGAPFALNMNKRIIEEIAHPTEGIEHTTPLDVTEWMLEFVNLFIPENGFGVTVINVAGKNFNAFDRLFLNKLVLSEKLSFRHRVLDPAIMCCDWDKDTLPNLNDCLHNVGLPNKVKHTAVLDAIDVIRIIRKSTNNYSKEGT